MANAEIPSTPDVPDRSGSLLHWADVVVITGYFVLVLAVGIWASRETARNGSISSYFLAGRSINFVLVGASLFASNIGSGHFVGLAGSGASTGIGIAATELGSVFIILLLGWVFVPVYMACGVYTMPEYLQKRYGGQRIRVYLSVLTILLYVSTKISADIYAGAIFIEQTLRWDLYVSVVILLIISAIFTVSGGLNAVIWTDFVQCVIMLAGSLTLLVVAMIKVDGYHSLMERFPKVRPKERWENTSSCAEVPKDFLHLVRSADDPELPWPGVIFGLSVSSMWYWCADQVIVQRVLASKNYAHAKASCVVAGYLKLLPMFLMVLPGMAARVLFPDDVACVVPEICEKVCGSREGCTNIAYPKIVIELLPAGLRGLLLAVMLAALMSSLTSIFNSSSTIFTIDLWKNSFRPTATETELVIVGRIFTCAMIIISLLWVPLIRVSKGSQLMVYIQAVTSYLAPPVACVYFLGILTHRANEKGAFWSLLIGLLIGVLRFAMDFFVYPSPPCGSLSDDRPAIIKHVHYLHFGLILFILCVIITMVVSFLSEEIPQQRLYRLTYALRNITKQRNYSASSSRSGLEMVVQENGLENEPFLVRSFRKMCCMAERSDIQLSPAEIEFAESHMLSLVESPKMRWSSNISALVLLAICIFLWGFFA